MTSPVDLHAVVDARLARITFITLRLEIIAVAECSTLDEGTSASFTQGVKINGSVAIFLDHWGWGRPHNRYSFAVFRRIDGGWRQVQSRIEDISDAVALAIHALAIHALSEQGVAVDD